jgi:hypothetical protein
MAQILFFFLLSFALTQPTQAEWKPDNPKKFCKQEFEKVKKTRYINRDECFKELTDGQNTKILKPTPCGEACVAIAKSGNDLAECISLCDHWKKDCSEVCKDKAENGYDMGWCFTACPSNFKKSLLSKGCHKACNKKSKKGSELGYCFKNCPQWSKMCGEDCTSVATDGRDLSFCIFSCPRWNKKCSDLCVPRAKDGKDLQACFNDACRNIEKEPWPQICAHIYKKSGQDFGSCVNWLGRKNWKDSCTKACGGIGVCVSICPWNNECANQCRIDSETADDLITCVKKCE